MNDLRNNVRMYQRSEIRGAICKSTILCIFSEILYMFIIYACIFILFV